MLPVHTDRHGRYDLAARYLHYVKASCIHQVRGITMIRFTIVLLSILAGCSFGVTFPENFHRISIGMNPAEARKELGTSSERVDSVEVDGMMVRTERYLVETGKTVETSTYMMPGGRYTASGDYVGSDARGAGYENQTRTKYDIVRCYLVFVNDSLRAWGNVEDYLTAKDPFMVAVGKAIKAR